MVVPRLRALLPMILGPLAAVGMLLLLGISAPGSSPVEAGGPDGYDLYYVAPGGECGLGWIPCYATIQAAADAADHPDDVIKVAGGTYARPAPVSYEGPAVISQVLYLSQTLTLRGGYTTTDWSSPHPISYPVTLDAGGTGRALVIGGDISPTLEGLRLQGGDAAGLGGGLEGGDLGGGAYIISATALLSVSQVLSSSAQMGGGLALWYSASTVDGCILASNAAFEGGGLYLYGSSAALRGNTLIGNRADGDGGGASLFDSSAALIENAFISNIATHQGGGLRVGCSDATISDNQFTANVAAGGGGLALNDSGGPCDSQATIGGNTFEVNTAREGGGLYLSRASPALLQNTVLGNASTGLGGGMWLISDHSALSGNAVSGNVAAWGGGGLYLFHSGASLRGDMVLANETDGVGGGLLTDDGTQVEAVNVVITDNHARVTGGGIYLQGTIARLLHATIARNTAGDGSGVYLSGALARPSTAWLTNTIVVSHSVGITVGSASTLTLRGVLWDGNGVEIGGTGAISASHILTGSPAFAADGYHITFSSAARDTGIEAGLAIDVDGEPRPGGTHPDIGADEFYPNPISVTLAGASTGIVGTSAVYTAAVTPPTASLPVCYAWQATGQSPVTHTAGLSDTMAFTWTAPGVQTVMVSVASAGATGTATHWITTYLPVQASFVATPTEGVIPLRVTFANASTGDWSALQWTFGDGSTNTLANPVHVYTATGAFTVTLAAWGPGGNHTTARPAYVTARHGLYLPAVLATR
jgi:hypothetical protein